MVCRKTSDCEAYYFDSSNCYVANEQGSKNFVPAPPGSSSTLSVWLNDRHKNESGGEVGFTVEPKCFTNGDGDAKNTACVEGTWKWRGKYWADANGETIGCANPDQGNSGLWCATEVDSDGIYQNWGYCNMDMEACKKNGMIHFHLALSSWPRET